MSFIFSIASDIIFGTIKFAAYTFVVGVVGTGAYVYATKPEEKSFRFPEKDPLSNFALNMISSKEFKDWVFFRTCHVRIGSDQAIFIGGLNMWHRL